ncbi:formyltransferase family protein [Pseudomonas wadenswilerensis]|uniref:Bifunctional polymyxin resistance protein ArnA n=1 Tax=Pseudomonas wadenswilerensis TaxID=1785161 RepID=A0A380SWQ6_9PSED|nr:formyltransferase family protein [Pseudomonas wadenswilerensis]SUQ62175.1 Bifunctional polymyxin resistance protein ArnA [Pseudomonas wadenswilerensis]
MNANKSKFKLLTLFVMTEKGLAFTELAVMRFKDIIAEVVIGQDPSVIDDFSANIARICATAGVKHSFRKDFEKITSEYAMTISWRWLIHHPAEKLIVFHDSLLPRYRGFAPLVNALINGEKSVGVSALFGASEYDRGDIIHQSAVEIDYPITISQAITLVNTCYLNTGTAVLTQLASGAPLNATAQDEALASYSLWRDDADYHIDWNQSAETIRRTIDALGHPYKGAFCRVDGVAARILQATEVEDVRIENRTPGKVIFVDDGLPVVVCASGLLKITSCINDADCQSLLPLAKFRVRFS